MSDIQRYEIENMEPISSHRNHYEMAQRMHGNWVRYDDHAAELAARDEAIRVLGEECKLHREFRSRLITYTLNYLDLKGEKSVDAERRLIGAYGATKQKTNANPLARAAVEGNNNAD